MEFRPCIDIHNGQVKQIVGSSLADKGDYAAENFVATADAAFYAGLYKELGIKGGHVILLNSKDSEYYEQTKAQAYMALREYPGFLQVGGGITADNAADFLDAGASHVIVTSYVFKDGRINYDNLNKLVAAVGSKHIVLDLSCKKTSNGYYIVTDRWQNMSDVKVDLNLMESLSQYCDEYLIHAVDVEGKCNGIEEELVTMLGNYNGLPVTYAGGVGTFKDLEKLKALGQSRVNVTIGSALDLFGGSMPLKKVLEVLHHN